MAFADYQDGLWIHYSKLPQITINPKPFHQDPAGLYLFPEKFETEGNWHRFPYRIVLKLKPGLRVLEIANLMLPEIHRILEHMGFQDMIGDEWLNESREPRDNQRRFWEIIRQRFMGEPGRFNKAWRRLGYDAIWDEAQVVHSAEKQLIVLEPRFVELVRVDEQKSTGYEEVMEVLEALRKKFAGIGEIEVRAPKKQRMWGEKFIEGSVTIKRDQDEITFKVKPWFVDEKTERIPEEISVRVGYNSANLTHMRSYGVSLKFRNFKEELHKLFDPKLDIVQAMRQVFGDDVMTGAVDIPIVQPGVDSPDGYVDWQNYQGMPYGGFGYENHPMYSEPEEFMQGASVEVVSMFRDLTPILAASAEKPLVTVQEDTIEIEIDGKGELAGHLMSGDSINMWLELPEDWEWGEAFAEYAVIESLAVKPEFRREGVGTDLVKAFIQTVRKLHVDAIFLNASPMSLMGYGDKIPFEQIHAFYRSLGFQDWEGPRNDHPDNRIMVMELRKLKTKSDLAFPDQTGFAFGPKAMWTDQENFLMKDWREPDSASQGFGVRAARDWPEVYDNRYTPKSDREAVIVPWNRLNFKLQRKFGKEAIALYRDQIGGQTEHPNYIAIQDKKLAGALWYSDYFQPQVAKNVWEFDVAVAPQFQRKGIATALLEKLIDAANQAERTIVAVPATREGRELLNKFNFERIPDTANMYSLTAALAGPLKLYCDMDGVVSDFDQMYFDHWGEHPPEGSTDDFWQKVDQIPNFWTDMPWMPDGPELWDAIRPRNPTMLSAPSQSPQCIPGKKEWIAEHLGMNVPAIFETDKYKYAAPNAVLIDDKPENIQKWEEAGGIGILHESADKTLEKLSEIAGEPIAAATRRWDARIVESIMCWLDNEGCTSESWTMPSHWKLPEKFRKHDGWVYRGVGLTKEQLDAIKKNKPIDIHDYESWTKDPQVAHGFAFDVSEPYGVIFRYKPKPGDVLADMDAVLKDPEFREIAERVNPSQWAYIEQIEHESEIVLKNVPLKNRMIYQVLEHKSNKKKSKMRECEHCGKKVRDGYTHCPNCSEPMAAAVQAAVDLPEDVVDAFTELAEAQRGAPEIAMNRLQHFHSGVLSFVVEHTGDLTHRMSEMAQHAKQGYGMGQEYVKEKVDKVLGTLQHGYGFAKENEENIQNNAEYKKMPIAEYRKKLDELLARYAAEHRKLTVWNAPQYYARTAAIALGEKKWDRAEMYLQFLKRIADLPRDEYIAAVTHVDRDANGKLLPYDLHRAAKSQSEAEPGMSNRALAKATLPADSDLMTFYNMADRQGWAEEVNEESKREWDAMSEEERLERIPELISHTGWQHIKKGDKINWEDALDAWLSMREDDAQEYAPTSETFFENAKIIKNPTLVRFTDYPGDVLEDPENGMFEGHGPENLGLTVPYGRPGSGDLAFAFNIKELKTRQDWKNAQAKYGKYIFKFKVPYAVEADHVSDDERQTVFDVTTVTNLQQVNIPEPTKREKFTENLEKIAQMDADELMEAIDAYNKMKGYQSIKVEKALNARRKELINQEKQMRKFHERRKTASAAEDDPLAKHRKTKPYAKEKPEYVFEKEVYTDWQSTVPGQDKSYWQDMGKYRSGYAYGNLPARIKLFVERFGEPDWVYTIRGKSAALHAIYFQQGKNLIQLWNRGNILSEYPWKEFERQAEAHGLHPQDFYRGEIDENQGYWLKKPWQK